MDLNFLYSEHQHSLMRAMSSTCANLRKLHLAAAGSLAERIQDWQHSNGAGAAKGWASFMNGADFSDLNARRVPA